MSELRLGFVGVGGMGQCAHLKHYVALKGCRVVAIAEPMAEKARRVAQRYDIPTVYADANQMLKKEPLDAVVAIQNFGFHGSVLPGVLERGLPVMIEKPLANSLPMGEKLLALAQRHGTRCYVGYHKRSDPATMLAVAQIDKIRQSGHMGPLKYVRLTMPSGDWIQGGFDDLINTQEPYPALTADPAPTGWSAARWEASNAFVNYYIHQVNLMRHLMREPYQVEHVDRSNTLIQTASVSGVPGLLEMSPFNTPHDWLEEALVCFERGFVRLELPAPLASHRPGRVTILDDGEGAEARTTSPWLPWTSAMRQQAMNFLEAVRGGSTPLCTAEEALEDLRIAWQYMEKRP